MKSNVIVSVTLESSAMNSILENFKKVDRDGVGVILNKSDFFR